MHLRTIAAVLMSMCLYTAQAQTFGYSLQKDSSGYSPLNGATVLSTAENFRSRSFMIDLPFTFNFCGAAADSISVEGNGFIVFDKQKQTAIVAYNNFGSNKDTAQNYSSSILYVTEGASGSKIMKIEFRKLSQNTLSTMDHLSYQVWLYENGNKIEFHTGANSYNMAGSELPVLIGLINRNMDTETKAYLASGDPASPAGQVISGESSLVYLNTIPPEGTTIKLTPTF